MAILFSFKFGLNDVKVKPASIVAYVKVAVCDLNPDPVVILVSADERFALKLLNTLK